MFVKEIYNNEEYVPVDWCMNKEDCRVGAYSEMSLEEGVSTIIEQFDNYEFVGVYNNYRSLVNQIHKDCKISGNNFDTREASDELIKMFLEFKDVACIIRWDDHGNGRVFSFEEFNRIAQTDIELYFKGMASGEVFEIHEGLKIRRE